MIPQTKGRKFPALRESAQQILQKAFDKMVSKKEVEAGSTTAVIVGLSIEEFGSKNLILKNICINTLFLEEKPEEPRTILLNTANLGDSGRIIQLNWRQLLTGCLVKGFLVIRDGKKIYRSKEQQQPGHFNAPFQLAIYPATGYIHQWDDL